MIFFGLSSLRSSDICANCTWRRPLESKAYPATGNLSAAFSFRKSASFLKIAIDTTIYQEFFRGYLNRVVNKAVDYQSTQ